MTLHKEIEFENDICAHLAASGWLYAEGDATAYDRVRALFPADLIAWIQQTQEKAWEALAKNHGASAEATRIRLRSSRRQEDVVGHQRWSIASPRPACAKRVHQRHS